MRLLVRAGLHSTHPHLQVCLHLAGPAQSCSQSPGRCWPRDRETGPAPEVQQLQAEVLSGQVMVRGGEGPLKSTRCQG